MVAWLPLGSVASPFPSQPVAAERVVPASDSAQVVLVGHGLEVADLIFGSEDLGRGCQMCTRVE